ncbi:hypothetical protein F0562_030139 [Nyssa sinensis]|uniref:RIN4 pathogenic type III effector avirulence factor Avr cleavage site domain-containing protein n=1 Tax=Nyssa sinensis TaxID=561372 RepID=A0A5J5AZ65_9ASTE|nr:hypothetical protein F0562_030139 [Nyssa sinensis]
MQIIGLGTVVMMPLIGNLSDVYGRKALLTLPLTLSIIPLGLYFQVLVEEVQWDVNDPASAEGYTVIFNKATLESQFTEVLKKSTQNKRSSARTEEKINSARVWYLFNGQLEISAIVPTSRVWY